MFAHLTQGYGIRKEKEGHTENNLFKKEKKKVPKKENKIRKLTEEEYEAYIRKISEE